MDLKKPKNLPTGESEGGDNDGNSFEKSKEFYEKFKEKVEVISVKTADFCKEKSIEVFGYCKRNPKRLILIPLALGALHVTIQTYSHFNELNKQKQAQAAAMEAFCVSPENNLKIIAEMMRAGEIKHNLGYLEERINFNFPEASKVTHPDCFEREYVNPKNLEERKFPFFGVEIEGRTIYYLVQVAGVGRSIELKYQLPLEEGEEIRFDDSFYEQGDEQNQYFTVNITDKNGEEKRTTFYFNKEVGFVRTPQEIRDSAGVNSKDSRFSYSDTEMFFEGKPTGLSGQSRSVSENYFHDPRDNVIYYFDSGNFYPAEGLTLADFEEKKNENGLNGLVIARDGGVFVGSQQIKIGEQERPLREREIAQITSNFVILWNGEIRFIDLANQDLRILEGQANPKIKVSETKGGGLEFSDRTGDKNVVFP